MTIEYGPIRIIKDDLVISPSAPRLAVRYGPMLIYLGDLQYIRHETFHVEEFILINPSGIGHVRQMLLIHFAGYLENKEGAYQYMNQQVATLEGDTYHLDHFMTNLQDPTTKLVDSDIARAADYIRQRSYTLAGEMAFQRFRRVVSDDNRCEFSILYAEPVDETPPAPEVLLERSMQAFEIVK